MRILMYHQVVEGRPPNVHAVNAGEFARQLDWLRESGYRSIYLEDGLAGAARDKTVALTFDDGYRDFLETVQPLLRERGFVATLFLIAGLMGKRRRWPDGDDDSCPPFLTWDEARQAAAAGEVRFGSHTLSHPDLSALAPAEVERELVESRRLIEEESGAPVAALSYPYGRHNAGVRACAEAAGYRLACAVTAGYAGPAGRERYQLDRISVLAADTLADFAQKVRGGLRRRAAWQLRRLRQALKRRGG